MDIPWGDPRLEKFVTGVGLITSDGPHGPNLMACESTHWISYVPGLVTVSVGNGKATWENIKATKEFGVSLAAADQAMVARVGGNFSGKKVDKIAALRELGTRFTNATHIRPLLVEGAALHVECKLVQEFQVGDHTLFVGEVLEARASDQEPLGYRQGSFFTMTRIPKPADAPRIDEIVRKHARGGGT